MCVLDPPYSKSCSGTGRFHITQGVVSIAESQFVAHLNKPPGDSWARHGKGWTGKSRRRGGEEGDESNRDISPATGGCLSAERVQEWAG